jgi:CheY-like chemotaxis protein
LPGFERCIRNISTTEARIRAKIFRRRNNPLGLLTGIATRNRRGCCASAPDWVTLQPSVNVIPGRAAALAKILIVDDDSSVQATLRVLLEGAGHTVVAANDGRRGLDRINAEAFDLLFLDIFMPGMDGFETLRLVRRQRPSLPIVAMSGRPLPSDSADGPNFLAMATKLGAIRSLQKPFRPHLLLTTVAACLEAAKRPSSQDAAGKIASGL